MKTSCIATIAILGCASAAPRRMRTAQRSLQDGSMSMSMPGADAESGLFDTEPGSAEPPATTVAAVTIPADITTATPPEDEGMPTSGESMSMPTTDVTGDVAGFVDTLMSTSMSLPEVGQGMIDGSMPMSGMTSADTEEPDSDDVTSGTDDPSGDDTPAGQPDDGTGDRGMSSAAGAILSGAASVACLAGAIALF